MSIVEISFSPDGGSLISIAFDAITSEHHVTAVEISSHAIERGGDVSDHARVGLAHLSIAAIVTDTPIRQPTSNMDGITGSVRPLTLTVPVKNQLPIAVPGAGAILAGAGVLDSTISQNVQVLQFDSDFSRCRSVYDQLRLLAETATECTVFTSLREYDHMLIQSISSPRSVQGGGTGSIEFTIEMQEVRFVDLQRTALPKTKTTSVGKVKKGKVPLVPATPAVPESLWHKLKGG